MTNDYSQLARKLQLLARPRLRVTGSADGLQIALLENAAEPTVLVAYEFTCTVPGYDLNKGENIMALSGFLELAALKLEERAADEPPVSFAQDLYNRGFWMHPTGASAWLSCEIVALEYDLAKW
jgi:hypothetical protein